MLKKQDGEKLGEPDSKSQTSKTAPKPELGRNLKAETNTSDKVTFKESPLLVNPSPVEKQSKQNAPQGNHIIEAASNPKSTGKFLESGVIQPVNISDAAVKSNTSNDTLESDSEEEEVEPLIPSNGRSFKNTSKSPEEKKENTGKPVINFNNSKSNESLTNQKPQPVVNSGQPGRSLDKTLTPTKQASKSVGRSTESKPSLESMKKAYKLISAEDTNDTMSSEMSHEAALNSTDSGEEDSEENSTESSDEMKHSSSSKPESSWETTTEPTTTTSTTTTKKPNPQGRTMINDKKPDLKLEGKKNHTKTKKQMTPENKSNVKSDAKQPKQNLESTKLTNTKPEGRAIVEKNPDPKQQSSMSKPSDIKQDTNQPDKKLELIKNKNMKPEGRTITEKKLGPNQQQPEKLKPISKNSSSLKNKTLPISKPSPNSKSIPSEQTSTETELDFETTESPLHTEESESEEIHPKGRSMSGHTNSAEEDGSAAEDTEEIDVTTPPPPKFNVPPEQIKFAKEGLEAHNKYRRLHGVQPLILDPNLVHESFEWAKVNAAKCDKPNKCELKNTIRQDRGENIYAVKGVPSLTGEKPVDYWYKEIKQYNWTSPGYQWKAGHFSQVVWKTSKRMGMALVKSKRGIFIACAMYAPPGNVAYPMLFKSNVLPPIDGPNV